MKGKRLGKYIVGEFIGKGSMGEVYRGKEINSDREVALKIVETAGWRKDKKVKHFIRSAKLSLSLSHPHLVKGLEIGRKWKVYFLAMELAKNGNLQTYLTNKLKLPIDEIYSMVKQIIRALDFIHRRGIIHRDIKPSNILLFGNGVVKLSDFDLFHPSGHRDFHKVLPKGTPHYMAPEQIRGGRITPSSDIYSLGVTIYQMLTGTTPYKGNSPEEILIKHLNFNPASVREANKEIPQALENCIMKCLEKEPYRRYSDVWEFWEDFHNSIPQDERIKSDKSDSQE